MVKVKQFMILTFSFFLMLHLSCVRAIIMEMLAVFSTGFPTGIDNRVSHRDYAPHMGSLSKIWLVNVGELPRRIPYKAAYEIQVNK